MANSETCAVMVGDYKNQKSFTVYEQWTCIMSLKAATVFGWLVHQTEDAKGGQVYVSIKKMEAELGLARRAQASILKELKDLGVVKISLKRSVKPGRMRLVTVIPSAAAIGGD